MLLSLCRRHERGRLKLCIPRSAGVAGVLLSFLAVSAGVAHGLDPKFALDPDQIRKSVGVEQKTAAKRTAASSTRSVKKRSGVMTLRTSPESAGMGSEVRHLTGTVPEIGSLRQFWEALVPHFGPAPQPVVMRSESYELSIDPVRYPLLRAADGKTIMMDSEGSLPPLVRTLLQQKDPSLRIVGTAGDGHRFLGSLLAAGGFYSVEEHPVLHFGADPRLTVRTDFKVERSAESVLRNEVTLVSASRQGLPPRLVDYLQSQGFSLLEPFAARAAAPMVQRHQVVRVGTENQGQAVDLLLELLVQPAERNRRVELFSPLETGVSLTVTVDRLFDRAGQRYAVARFTGDPVAYTLYRMLETKGYRVVILEPQDSFRAVASKLLGRMGMSSAYHSHVLVAEPSGQYRLEMSGFLLENSLPGGGAVMVTDRLLDRSVRDLLSDHGYQVQDR